MTKPIKRPTITKQQELDGYLYTYDQNDRLCFNLDASERVVLLHDLRAYHECLHIGSLGWTRPDTSDGYTEIRVQFDGGPLLLLKSCALERVVEKTQDSVVESLLKKFRDTRFDCDPVVVRQRHSEWTEKTYGTTLDISDVVSDGNGDQELYAFTFASLQALATVKGETISPVKIGYSKNASTTCFGRIRMQIGEKAAFPERPKVILVRRTWNGRELETKVHRKLKAMDRKCVESLGTEWYRTNISELIPMVQELDTATLPADRVITGADETLEDDFATLMAQGGDNRNGDGPRGGSG